MKYIAIILLIAIPLMAQHDNAIYWGSPQYGDTIKWGNVFQATDSLKLIPSVVPPYMYNSYDTLFTDMMPLQGDGIEGILTISFSIDSVDAVQDSIDLDLRFYYNKNLHTRNYWGVWRPVLVGGKSDTLYVYNSIPADSTWWGPAAGWQFRVKRRDAADDSLSQPHLVPFMR